MKLRIAFFSWESLHSLRVGGLAVHVTELAAALERLGNEVHVFTRIGPNQGMYSLIDGVHYHRVSFGFENDLIRELTVNMARSMVERFNEVENVFGNFDIIHGHDWHVVTALDEIKRTKNKKTVFTLHSTQYGRDGNNFFDGAAKVIRDLEWFGTYIADRVIVCSQTMKDEIMKIYQTPEYKIRVIPNGIWAKNFDGEIDAYHDVKKHFGFNVYDPVIVFFGRMTHMKGVDLLLESVPLVLQEFPNAKFIFIGDGYARAEFERRAYELGLLNNHVFFTGYVNDEWKTKIVKASDCVVVPSRNEPFGIVVLEAWSCKKPVIASCGTGAGELIWNGVNGYKVQLNPESIADGIKQIIRNPMHAKYMGENGRKIAETIFNWDNIAKQTLRVYEELLEK
ncbi:MAG: glycosyltransferase family 4 protein [Candidatus Aenigmatarchaeota archaeon]